MIGTVLLDSEGLSKVASGDRRMRALLTAAYEENVRTVVSAITLTEVLRGGPGDAVVHRALSRVDVLPVTAALARRAGELLGATGMSGHRCAIDAVVAATALSLPRSVVVLTSDPDGLGRLVKTGATKGKRVVVVQV